METFTERRAMVENALYPRERRAALGALSLGAMTAIDPGYLQFGSVDWFLERWLNSHALQVEPARHRTRDEVVLAAGEAAHVEHVRDLFFGELRRLVAREVGEGRAD